MENLYIRRANYEKNNLMLHQTIQDDFMKLESKGLETMFVFIRMAIIFGYNEVPYKELKELNGCSDYKLKIYLDTLLKMNYLIKIKNNYKVNTNLIYVDKDNNDNTIIDKLEE